MMKVPTDKKTTWNIGGTIRSAGFAKKRLRVGLIPYFDSVAGTDGYFSRQDNRKAPAYLIDLITQIE
jgi:hypothetical protein